MASSNRHWPSMFKSKPCNTTTTHHQWQQQHDVNSTLLSSPCTRTPFNTPGCEERTPEPKPRWNPRPEQIGILESIFNSGMVNPPRDEIRKIRAQLQEFGQVGDANVFYWFQNRKSRSKHKHRQNLHHTPKSRHPQQTTTPPPPSSAAAAPPSSSSSSSDKSSPNNSSEKSLSVGPITVIDLLNSPTASVNQPFFHANANDFLAEPFFFPAVQQQNAGATHSPPPSSITQGFYFPDSIVADQNTVPSNFLLSELMLMGHYPSSKKDEDDKIKFHQQQQNLSNYASTSAPNPCQPILPPPFSVPSINQILQGAGETVGPTRSTVFINDVCFEVGYGPFSVREAFGDDAVLIHSSGHPVLTNEWGVTLHPLQHGAFYYLSRPFAPPSPVDRTIDLI
ncbi:hypothetical protein ABFS83_13G101000 [Erythranthe nasuta]